LARLQNSDGTYMAPMNRTGRMILCCLTVALIAFIARNAAARDDFEADMDRMENCIQKHDKCEAWCKSQYPYMSNDYLQCWKNTCMKNFGTCSGLDKEAGSESMEIPGFFVIYANYDWSYMSKSLERRNTSLDKVPDLYIMQKAPTWDTSTFNGMLVMLMDYLAADLAKFDRKHKDQPKIIRSSSGFYGTGTMAPGLSFGFYSEYGGPLLTYRYYIIDTHSLCLEYQYIARGLFTIAVGGGYQNFSNRSFLSFPFISVRMGLNIFMDDVFSMSFDCSLWVNPRTLNRFSDYIISPSFSMRFWI
jgi:hypothetical protein